MPFTKLNRSCPISPTSYPTNYAHLSIIAFLNFCNLALQFLTSNIRLGKIQAKFYPFFNVIFFVSRPTMTL